jgi:hypothetical protein
MSTTRELQDFECKKLSDLIPAIKKLDQDVKKQRTDFRGMNEEVATKLGYSEISKFKEIVAELPSLR